MINMQNLPILQYIKNIIMLLPEVKAVQLKHPKTALLKRRKSSKRLSLICEMTETHKNCVPLSVSRRTAFCFLETEPFLAMLDPRFRQPFNHLAPNPPSRQRKALPNRAGPCRQHHSSYPGADHQNGRADDWLILCQAARLPGQMN